jgi:cellulose synthase/poly-beta-1,6-N-acetylglucosamine synthase-like glycosyltransferase
MGFGVGKRLWSDEKVPDDWPVLGIGFRPSASKRDSCAHDGGLGHPVASIMTSSFLGIVGRTANLTLVVLLLMQLALAFRVSQTVLLHLRYRRAGLERERLALSQPLPAEDELPAVLIQIPTFNEGHLVRRALNAAISLDWPHDRLQIQLLDDSTDASAEIARATVAEFGRHGPDVTLIQRPHRAGFKAGALAAGLACSNQPFVAVFDADYVPSSDFLRLCLRPLLGDPYLAFVQARCDFLNAQENRVTRAQQVILESHFAVEQPTRCWAGQILPFNGTCGIWRRAAIEAAGGWHGDTLTEDLDLSYRAQMRGWRALYLVSVAVPGELPNSLASWGEQQCRWNKGFAETARKLLPSIWRANLTWGRKLNAALHLGGCAIGLLAAATGIVCGIAFFLGTLSYSVVLLLATLGLLQGVVGAFAMALLSSYFLRGSGVDPQAGGFVIQARGFVTICRLTLYTILMHQYAAALSASSVFNGMRGRRSGFVRTPKRVRLSD